MNTYHLSHAADQVASAKENLKALEEKSALDAKIASDTATMEINTRIRQLTLELNELNQSIRAIAREAHDASIKASAPGLTEARKGLTAAKKALYELSKR